MNNGKGGCEMKYELQAEIESMNEDLGDRCYRGNSISYIYQKMKCYQNQIGAAGEIMRKYDLIKEFEQALKESGE